MLSICSDHALTTLFLVFLRVLEYYEGILFLTTNRLESFDRAFKSRVHLPIHYPALEADSRRRIWEAFLSKVSETACRELDAGGALDRFSAVNLNGRQIKNVVRIAHARAVSEGKDITSEYIEEALEAMEDFDERMEMAKAAAAQRNAEAGEASGSGSRKRRRIMADDEELT